MVGGCAAQSDPDDNADSSQNSDFCLNNHDVGYGIGMFDADGC